MMTNRAKTIIRWGGIASVFAIYSIVLMILVFDFGLTRKYNGPLQQVRWKPVYVKRS